MYIKVPLINAQTYCAHCATHCDCRLTYVLMALLFAVTTPLGVGIGLGIRTTYNENSATALGVQGTFESVSIPFAAASINTGCLCT